MRQEIQDQQSRTDTHQNILNEFTKQKRELAISGMQKMICRNPKNNLCCQRYGLRVLNHLPPTARPFNHALFLSIWLPSKFKDCSSLVRAHYSERRLSTFKSLILERAIRATG